MKKFISNQTPVECIQLSAENLAEVYVFIFSKAALPEDAKGSFFKYYGNQAIENKQMVFELDGIKTINFGEWAVKTPKGKVLICENQVFEELFRPAE